jgi:hypothetical protein
VEGQTETQEVRNQEDEPEVRDHTESREPNKERLESNQIKIDEVRDQNEHIELTEEREEGEVIDSENENEGKNSEQNEKKNTFAEDLIDVLQPFFVRFSRFSMVSYLWFIFLISYLLCLSLSFHIISEYVSIRIV